MINKVLILIISTMFAINGVNAKSFTAAELTSAALDTDCLDYCVDGVCFWLVCGFFGCKVKTTPHIKHNLPDLVVSTYNNTGDSPFTETKLLDIVPLIDGGNLDANKKKATQIKFKEVSVIGNPVAYAMGEQRYLCQSNITPYMPYFLSTLDALSWRSGLTEMFYPASYIPGLKEVGSVFNSWGGIYPRQGFINQPNDIKAGAVIAERALDIVSNDGLGHIYQHSSGTNSGSGKWQMISPEEQSCRVFGNREPDVTADEKGQHAWVAWREYSCCVPSRGWHIEDAITGCLF